MRNSFKPGEMIEIPDGEWLRLEFTNGWAAALLVYLSGSFGIIIVAIMLEAK